MLLNQASVSWWQLPGSEVLPNCESAARLTFFLRPTFFICHCILSLCNNHNTKSQHRFASVNASHQLVSWAARKKQKREEVEAQQGQRVQNRLDTPMMMCVGPINYFTCLLAARDNHTSFIEFFYASRRCTYWDSFWCVNLSTVVFTLKSGLKYDLKSSVFLVHFRLTLRV